MPLDRPALSPEHSGSHRLEIVPEPTEPVTRPSLRLIEAPGRTPPAPGIGDFAPTALDAPELYLNRELTYLNFCWRVLHEAEDDRVPVLERVKFLGIVSSNLDEFFQKRIGGLKQQVGAQLHAITPKHPWDKQSLDLNWR